MATLSFYFPDDFPDPNWRKKCHRFDTDGNSKGEWIIGRSPACELVISHGFASIRHCAVAYSFGADQWSIRDLKSTNGTYQNGVKIPPMLPCPLKIGDSLIIAGRVYVVEDEQDTWQQEAVQEPEEETPRTFAEVLYLAMKWVVSAQTVQGGLYRLGLGAGATTLIIVLVEWLR